MRQGMPSFWSNLKDAALQKLVYEVGFLTKLQKEARKVDTSHSYRSSSKVNKSTPDRLQTRRRWNINAIPFSKTERQTKDKETLDENPKLLTHVEDMRAKDKQHHYQRCKKWQMTPDFVASVCHRRKNRQKVSPFLDNLVRKSLKHEQPTLGEWRSTNRGTTDPTCHTEAPDHPNSSLHRSDQGRLQYRKSLNHRSRDEKRATEPSASQTLEAEGSPGHPSAKNDRCPTCQERIVRKQATNPRLLGRMSHKAITVAFCANSKITQATATDRIEKVNSETTDKLARAVPFEEPPLEVVSSAKLTFNVAVGVGVNVTVLYFNQWQVDTGTSLNFGIKA